jgi:protein ImuB
LLAEPLKLTVHQQHPHYQGPLTLLAGPQRLEAGWWGGGDLALRDYFVARGSLAVLLWIYRERLGRVDTAHMSANWYLHGIFA